METQLEPDSQVSLLTEEKIVQYREKLKLEQNLPMGIASGAGAATVGAAVWALVTVGTGYQIGWMAVGVGFLVGYSIRFFGKGIDPIFGVIGGAFIILVYLLFLFRSIRIFKRCPYAFGAFLALGLSFTLVIQALINMAVAVNLFPVTGVTLPLVSMGGSSFLFTCLSIGIILSVARNVEQLEKPVKV